MIYKKLFNEEKQVGVIYHFTSSPIDLISILKNGLKGNLNPRGTNPKHSITNTYLTDKKLFSYSFTRNPMYKWFGNYGIKLDGTKMSNKYKFIPYSRYGTNKYFKTYEFEERLFSTKSFIDLKPFIISVVLTKPETIPKYNKGDEKYFEEIINLVGESKIDYHDFVIQDDVFKKMGKE